MWMKTKYFKSRCIPHSGFCSRLSAVSCSSSSSPRRKTGMNFFFLFAHSRAAPATACRSLATPLTDCRDAEGRWKDPGVGQSGSRVWPEINFEEILASVHDCMVVWWSKKCTVVFFCHWASWSVTGSYLSKYTKVYGGGGGMSGHLRWPMEKMRKPVRKWLRHLIQPHIIIFLLSELGDVCVCVGQNRNFIALTGRFKWSLIQNWLKSSTRSNTFSPTTTTFLSFFLFKAGAGVS